MTPKEPKETGIEYFSPDALHQEFTTGTTVRRIRFVAEWDRESTPRMRFQDPVQCAAMLTDITEAEHRTETLPDDVLLLEIPVNEQDKPDILERAHKWVQATKPRSDEQSQVITLHGAQIVWCHGVVALIAKEDRIASLQASIIHFTFYDIAIKKIENQVRECWPQFDCDMPLAFEFNEKAVPRREELSQRFQKVMSMKASLLRIAPHLNRAPIYPVTLASQMGERLRERGRLSDRIEASVEQIEVLERLYEMCGQRASEFMLSRNETTLEWIIITLLAMDTILLIVDAMLSLGN